jgi:hypothetical protein
MGASPYLVIVHASGWVDLEASPPFWTEVPAHAACASEGGTPEEAVCMSRDALHRWTRRDIEVEVFVAG